MARATHVVRSRLFHHGQWREPGTTIDASAWPTRQELEDSGDLVPLPPEDRVDAANSPAVKRKRPKHEKPKKGERKGAKGGPS